MALTQEEKNIAIELKKKGFDKLQIAGKISSMRLGKEKSEVDYIQEQNAPSLGEKIIKDIPSDFLETASGIRDAFKQSGENIVESATDDGLSTWEKANTIGAEAFRGSSRALGEGIVGVGKAFVSPEGEQIVAQEAQGIAQDILSDPDIQTAIDKYKALPEDTQRELRNIAGFAEGLLDLVGVGVGSKAVKSTVGIGRRSIGETIESGVRSIVSKFDDINIPKRPKKVKAGGVFKDVLDDIVPTADSMRDRLLAKSLNLAPVDDISRIQTALSRADDPFEIGEFMGRYKLIKNTPGETTEALAKFQADNYTRVSDTVALIDNTYKLGELPSLDNIVDFLIKELDGSTSQSFNSMLNRLKDIKKGGSFDLTNAQEIKRTFDELTSFYKRSGEVKDARRAADMTNNMRDVRRFIENEVKAQYPDIPIATLNQNVQASREILDAVVRRSGKVDTASLFQLGDMAILGAGNITAPGAGFAALFGKKFIESSPIQLRLANKLDDMARKAVVDGKLTPAELSGIDELLTAELRKSLSKQEINYIAVLQQKLEQLALPEGAVRLPAPVGESSVRAIDATIGANK